MRGLFLSIFILAYLWVWYFFGIDWDRIGVFYLAFVANLFVCALTPYKPSDLANGANPDQTPHNTASDDGLRCLLTNALLNLNKMKNTTNNP